jgi:hypothetical protein
LRIGNRDHVAAFAAIAAVRSAFGGKFLLAERETPVAAVAGGYFNLNVIDKHCYNIPNRTRIVK